MNELEHLAGGVDHVAFPTFDPAGTVRFYRGVLRFPVVHAISATGRGPEDHPDFVHFFFDVGNGDRLAFFYYFGLEAIDDAVDVPDFFASSRHLAIHVDSEEALLEVSRAAVYQQAAGPSRREQVVPHSRSPDSSPASRTIPRTLA